MLTLLSLHHRRVEAHARTHAVIIIIAIIIIVMTAIGASRKVPHLGPSGLFHLCSLHHRRVEGHTRTHAVIIIPIIAIAIAIIIIMSAIGASWNAPRSVRTPHFTNH